MKCKLNHKKSIVSTNMKQLNTIKILTNKYTNNMIYILLRVKDNTLKLSMQSSLFDYISNGYEIVGSKAGSKRELELTKIVLSEIEFNRFMRFAKRYADFNNLISKEN